MEWVSLSRREEGVSRNKKTQHHKNQRFRKNMHGVAYPGNKGGTRIRMYQDGELIADEVKA